MDFEPLAPQARLLFYLQSFSRLLLFWVPVTSVAALAAIVVFDFPVLWSSVGGLVWLFAMFLAAVWFPSLSFDRWGYAMTTSELLIQRGVLLRSITAIPLSRIQHVDTRQGVIEQWMGLARVQVYTASGVGSDGVIPGLELDQAEALRDRLVAVTGDDGV